jgi:hypothetical protein
MELTGILLRKLGERAGTSSRNGNEWKMAEFLIEVPGNYPRHTVFQVSDGQQNRISRFESLIGKTVKVSFDLDAHEWQGRWFNDIIAWGVMEYVVQAKQPPIGEKKEETTEAVTQEGGKDAKDDLPF